MKKIFLSLILGILLLNLVSAFSICIDKDPPSLANSSLSWTATSNTIQLSWIPATDIPSCSGIDHYEIYRSTNGTNFLPIGNSSTNTYTDSEVSSGITYYYMIHAFDLVGHNEANESLSHSVPISLIIESGNGDDDNGNGGSGGGGGGGSDNLFSCGKWEECIDGTQIRICENIGRNLPNRTETRNCFPDFIPLSFESNETWGDGGNETNETQDTTGLFSRMIGGVIGFAKSRGGKTSLIFTFTILILGAGVIFLQRKGHLKLKKS